MNRGGSIYRRKNGEPKPAGQVSSFNSINLNSLVEPAYNTRSTSNSEIGTKRGAFQRLGSSSNLARDAQLAL